MSETTDKPAEPSRKGRLLDVARTLGTEGRTWIEDRGGWISGLTDAVNPLVPRSSRLLYALGAALVASLGVEFITGLLMMTSYSPSTVSAWGSAFYIDEVITLGWFIRGLHSFASHAMFIVGGLYILSAVILKRYSAPRELNWWVSLGLLGLVIGFALTGNALVWDQDGYWAWHVETGIAGGAPVVGPITQTLIVGGSEMGNGTLGRLYALHVGLLPVLAILLLTVYFKLVRRHDATEASQSLETADRAWPRQSFFNALAAVIMIGVVSVLVILNKGVSLEAPADPSSFFPARPAWFFLWLFQLRKGFPGPSEMIATMVIPGALATVLALLPFFDRVFPKRLAHFAAVGFVFATLGGAAFLTVLGLRDDNADADYKREVEASAVARDRSKELAAQGIPPEGASVLLSHDPLFHGKPLLTTKCLGCHVWGGEGIGNQSASDLKDFGSRAWIHGLLVNPSSATYFGKVPGCDGMAEWKKGSKLDAKQLDQVTDFMMLLAKVDPDLSVQEWTGLKEVSSHPGLESFVKECGQCHEVEGLTEGGVRDAPALFGWGSPRWLERMIKKPGAPDLYGFLDKEQQMPAFGGQLSENDLNTIVRYIKNDYLGAEKPGGTPEAP